ncbi:MAG TPA: Gfo/Idh/MocA family oxidoreductase [Bdellovibrionota bacterium]|nr:Gfo/Idh/MocA family oxidoreductase [Bdellovibrionota bacterium]
MAKDTSPIVAIIGTGYWGINHVRVFFELQALGGIFDSDATRSCEVNARFHAKKSYEKLESVLSDSALHGLVISTPAVTHFEISMRALEMGKDVLVEKPLALRFGEAQQMADFAKSSGRILMVGHLLQYHPGMVKLRELVAGGDLGTVEYIYSNRLNLGKIRTEENALWSFAPHDISVMLWLTGAMPIQVNAVGGSYLQPNVADTTISTFVFDNGVRGHIYVSWLHPFKEQRLVVVGSKKMAVFDDRAPKGRKLLLYDKKVSMVNGNFVAEKPEGIPVPFDEETEPLRAECEHFLECVRTRQKPRTDGEEGLRVLKVLQSCQRSLQMNGQPVQVLEYRN